MKMTQLQRVKSVAQILIIKLNIDAMKAIDVAALIVEKLDDLEVDGE